MSKKNKAERSISAPQHASISYQLTLADLIIEAHEDILLHFNGDIKTKVSLADAYGKACLLKENIAKGQSFAN